MCGGGALCKNWSVKKDSGIQIPNLLDFPVSLWCQSSCSWNITSQPGYCWASSRNCLTIYINREFNDYHSVTWLNSRGQLSPTKPLKKLYPHTCRTASPIVLNCRSFLKGPPCKETIAHSHAFYVVAPTLWNSLPATIRKATQLLSFPQMFKTLFFRRTIL